MASAKWTSFEELVSLLSSGTPLSQALSEKVAATVKTTVVWIGSLQLADISEPQAQSLSNYFQSEHISGTDDVKQWSSLMRSFHAHLKANHEVAQHADANADLHKSAVLTSIKVLKELEGMVRQAAGEDDPGFDENLQACLQQIEDMAGVAKQDATVQAVHVLSKFAEDVRAVNHYLKQIALGGPGGRHWAAKLRPGQNILECFAATLSKVNKDQIIQHREQVKTVP